MKDTIDIYFGKEIAAFKAMSKKQKAVVIYELLSLAIFFLFACSDSMVGIGITFLNLCISSSLAYKYIPHDFIDEV